MTREPKAVDPATQDAETPVTVRSIKGFDASLKCRDFQFEIGKTYEHTGRVAACYSGFHACDAKQHPFSVFDYYAPAGSRYADVVQSGDLARDGGDAKIASARITVEARLCCPR